MFDLFKIECESLTGRYIHFWPRKFSCSDTFFHKYVVTILFYFIVLAGFF
jgi:hypothetical protein